MNVKIRLATVAMYCISFLLNINELIASEIELEGDNQVPISIHEAAAKNYSEILERFIRLGADVNAQDKDGLTPLHHAARNNALDAMSVLIESDVNLNAVNKNRMTPLNIAIQHGHYGFARSLINHGCDTNIQDVHGMTPLDYLLHKNDPEQNELLTILVGEINPLAEKKRAITSLHSAVDANNIDGLKSLIMSKNIPIDTFDCRGAPVIHYAGRYGNFALLQLLVDSGANIKAKSDSESTLLHEVCWSGNSDMLRYFFRLDGAIEQINDQNIFGETPLHRAVERNNYETVKQLLQQNNIDFSLRNNRGQTPFDIARNEGYIKLANLFKSYIAEDYDEISKYFLFVTSNQDHDFSNIDNTQQFLDNNVISNAILLISRLGGDSEAKNNILLYSVNEDNYEYCRSCVQAIAATVKCAMVEVDCSLLKSSEEIIQAFHDIEAYAPCIIFLDNFLSIAPSDVRRLNRTLALSLAKSIDYLNAHLNNSFVFSYVNQLEDVYKPLLVKFSSLDMSSITDQ